MNSLEDIENRFDAHFKKHGGRYAPPAGEDSYKDLILEMLRSAIGSMTSEANKLPEVYIDFINSDKVNACVSKDVNTGQYYIGINIGTLISLTGLFAKIVNDVENDGSKNDPAEEKISNFDPYLTDAKFLYAQLPADFLTSIPLESHMRSFRLTQMCLAYLLFHEYSHITNGHLDYLISIENRRTVFEYEEETQTSLKLSALQFQTLEFDADCGAIMFMRSYAMVVCQSEGLSSENHHLVHLNWFYAHFCLLRMFGLDFPSLVNKHPPSGLRQVIAIKMIAHLYSDGRVEEIEQRAITLTHIAIEVEKAFAKLSGANIDASAFLYGLQSESAVQYEKYLETWKILRPELVPFSFVNLAPVQI